MEETSTTNPKYEPLQILWHHSYTHARKTIPLVPIHLFTRQIGINNNLFEVSLTGAL